jgi:Winged helix DNA-binding domain
LQAGRDHLAERPSTRAGVSAVLSQRWPGVDSASLAYAINLLTPVLQVPPRGLWRQGGQARWATAETWLSRNLDEDPAPAELIGRYLAAFGPSTAADIQAWCGVTRLRAAIDGMRPSTRSFQDEDGNEMLDVPGAPLADPDAPAPPRLLAPFDNVLLAHSDRRRIIAPEHRGAVYRDRLMRAVLVDGFVAGTWRLEDHVIQIRPLGRLRKSDRAAVTEEAQRLLAFLTGDAPRGNVRFVSD